MSAPPSTSTPTGNAGRRPSVNPSPSQSSGSQSPTKMTTTMTTRGTTASAGTASSRTRSVRTSGALSARAAVRKPTVGSSSATIARTVTDQDTAADDDEYQAKTAQAIENLQDRLQRSEQAADDFQKQANILQARLDDTLKDTSSLEERLHEQQEHIEVLENEQKESTRLRRELESIGEADRAAVIKERQASQARDAERLDTIRRLKETLAQREFRVASLRNSISPHPEGGQFAPPSSLQRSDSQRSSRLVLEKDRIIESLRLELAEAQIKLVEMENMGGGQVHVLEKTLIETRVANARLLEDNESFQLLLSEKTLNGDFTSNELLSPAPRPTSRRRQSSSLADELEGASIEEDDDGHKRTHAELASLKDQNKALTLYINNIISRLLQHGDFESILDKNPDNGAPTPRATDKHSPPSPPEKDDAERPHSFLSRTRSMIGGRPQPRPLSQLVSKSESGPTANEDPATAPRIPLGRGQGQRSVSGGHRRANSEWATAAVVNNMYRGPSPTISGQLSPGIASPPSSTSFFGAVRPGSGNRVASGSTIPTISESDRRSRRTNRDSKESSSGNSVASNPDASDPSSPPQSTTSSSDKPSGAIMAGGKLRTLRLVQERSEEAATKKAANRGSWMGWFNKASVPAPLPARSTSRERSSEGERSLWPS